MASKRAPLASVPNAVNSPLHIANAKRTRAQAGDSRETVYGQPPAKKQIIEILDDGNIENVDPRRRSGVPALVQGKLEEPFSAKRPTNAYPTAFEKRLTAAREKKPTPQHRAERPQKPVGDIETVRQWKRHYKRQFPQFVFYFESVPDNVRVKAIQQLQSLGARHENFFSNAVTHVVTTRSIPPELNSTSPDDDEKYSTNGAKTIQPSALSKDQRRTTDLLDANLQRRAQTHSAYSHDVDPRRHLAPQADILTRARELGIKIWALEKMQRVLKTMLETDPDDEAAGLDSRLHATASKPVSKSHKDVDLEQLLRNEKINGPADRDMTVTGQDMIQLKGYYIYIHDMDEKTKPVMIRDYSKPEKKEQGKWPQLRVTSVGRCPFIEDPSHTKKIQEAQVAAKAEQELASQRKARGVPVAPQPLAEREANLRRSPRKLALQNKAELSKPLDPPKCIPAKRQSSAEGMPHLFGSAQQQLRGLPRMIGGEPVASGIQPSNVTSAIRSQAISSTAISSTAAGVNKRVGDSKEVSALKRKVLMERGVGGTSNYSMPTSYMNNVRAAINDDDNPPPRAAKRRAQETLGVLHEGDEDNKDDVRGTHRKPPPPRKNRPVKREPKPGFCENCHDKYDDFDDVSSRGSSLHTGTLR